jgi:outer membrane protein assembly factor BamB
MEAKLRHNGAVAAVVLLLGIPGMARATEWKTFGGSLDRLFFNPAETVINASTVDRLGVKWTYPADKIITAQAVVAEINLPVEGLTPVVFLQSWDGNMYAVRLADGSEVWSFTTDVQPGASYPNVGSAHVENVGGSDRVFFGAGETMYSLDAVSGAEVWRFDAGTGCDPFPGLCGFSGERNEVETSPLVVDGKVIFGMDVNDRDTGKGGVYAVDVTDGRLEWFFDLETGATCTPFLADDIRRFDGYHTETELGLPAGFLATRPGCNFDRSPTGCGNVWASPAADEGRQLLYFASSNCDTDNDGGTNIPPPPMPPYDEAIFALNYDGTAAWRWRPREVDNDDLSFGATPQLFTIDFDGNPREVVGLGNKDGTYYVIDRDGTNEVTGVAWNDFEPDTLPYWQTNLVPGGAAGGIISASSVDAVAERIYISTAPGFDPLDPQRPTVHALDMNDGSIVWQNTAEPNADASFAPTVAIPELVFVGSVLGGQLRFYDTDTGDKLGSRSIGFAIACGSTIVDGTLLVGGGIGELSANPNSAAYITAQVPHDITALCVLGASGCPARLAGKKLSVKDDLALPDKRAIGFLAKDEENTVSPDPGSPEDPTVNGATLTLSNPVTSESQAIMLPAAGWDGIGNPSGIKGYKYKDPDQMLGPCRSAQIKAGKLVKAKCSGAAITFTLDEATQGTLRVSLDVGPASEWRWCSEFGGEIIKDEGTVTTGDVGQFKAKSAGQPTACP